VRSQLIPGEVARWSRLLGITHYLDRESGAYSGGNKRKLNVAMALVAEPPVLFLDEPSTGVDPVARRRLWRVIQAVQHSGQSVVLTSHRLAGIVYSPLTVSWDNVLTERGQLGQCTHRERPAGIVISYRSSGTVYHYR
jgi:energy-coupling factor transporter ATP-binding protein EcfA2